MFDGFTQLAFIGPGGPELMVLMLVLLMMSGAKDAPRILRKLNEIMTHIRNTADGFKREIMYGDIHNEKPTYTPPEDVHDEDYGYGADDEPTEEIFQAFEDNLAEQPPKPESAEEGDDAQKT
ncbi:MAG: hypothetical protein K9M54_13840 [Kiritimatiellales bacterium]|nr:hypothetical protein [Kiritimatiellales bacterium]